MRRWLLALTVLVLVGCVSTEPMQLTPGFTARAKWVAPRCGVALTGLLDLRSDPTSLGTVGRQSVHSADLLAWLREGLGTITTSAPPTIRLQGELLIAYVQNQSTSMFTQLVVRLRYQRPGQQNVDKVYRGSYNKINWTNGPDEVKSTFDSALSDVLKQAAQDLDALCLQTPR